MSDFNTPRNVPNSFDAYDSWSPNWIFGLPQSGDISSAECGAMPFRLSSDLSACGNDISGVNLQRCLRAEDWAFLQTYCNSERSLPSYEFWNFNPQAPYTADRPMIQQPIRMYNWLSTAVDKKCFGSGVSIQPNSGFQVYEQDYTQMTSYIKAQLTGFPTLDSQPIEEDQPFSLEMMKNFFKDTQKLSCTLALGSLRWTATQTRWFYRYIDWFGDITRDTTNISGVLLTNSYGPQTQMVSAVAQIIMGVECTHEYNDIEHTYFAVLSPTAPLTLTTSEDAHRVLSCSVNITGQSIANLFSSVTGVNITPSHIGDQYDGRCTIRNRFTYLAFWPKWLVDYQWRHP